ncbi:MAG: CrcB family protein [Fimbriimonadaceae bacterium]
MSAPTLKDVGLVALGGALGAVSRLLIGSALKNVTEVPWGLLVINVLGSLLIGFFAAWTQTKPSPLIAQFVMIGILGGFTTFSAFSLDNLGLVQEGKWGVALLNMGLSCGLGLLAASGGFYRREDVSG